MNTDIEIEVAPNNLYRTGVLISYPDQSEYALMRQKIETVGTLEDEYHTVTVNDRLDTIAWKYYKDIVEDSSKFWWIIADVNNIYDPFDLSGLVGKTILIPDILNILIEL